MNPQTKNYSKINNEYAIQQNAYIHLPSIKVKVFYTIHTVCVWSFISLQKGRAYKIPHKLLGTQCVHTGKYAKHLF